MPDRSHRSASQGAEEGRASQGRMGEGAEAWRSCRDEEEEAVGKRMGEEVGTYGRMRGEEVGAFGRVVPRGEAEAFGRRRNEVEAKGRRAGVVVVEEEETTTDEVEEAEGRRRWGGVGEAAPVLHRGPRWSWTSRAILFSPGAFGSPCSG